MPEIIACPSCQRQLQIPENFFGQLVQCPDCQHQFEATPTTSAVQSTPPAPVPMKSPPAKSYSDDREPERPRRRFDEDDLDDDIGDLRSPRRPQIQPHRASVVLILGILSICCVGAPVTGIIAWLLGASDIKEMDAGRMDPSGRGQTQTGKVLGMVSVLLFVLGIVGYCLLMIVAGAGGAFGRNRRRF